MNSIAKTLAALLLSACVLLGGVPAGAEEPTAQNAPGTTEVVKAGKSAKGAKKKKKKGGKKKGAKKKKKAASASATA